MGKTPGKEETKEAFRNQWNAGSRQENVSACGLELDVSESKNRDVRSDKRISLQSISNDVDLEGRAAEGKQPLPELTVTGALLTPVRSSSEWLL
ncbi:unnamed protein product [Nippostrongylus brasiliensis]|uniref:Uncharacterized protein n=1 Tax=Nippostrongylus brasiliensis TaxID=27835 RepID=A0A0N4XYY2_NIPBR|nr:unnamed protein product [Nippostrongylus brasiliensis]